MIKSTFFLLLVACFLFACNNKTYTPADLPDTQLHFGSGGGFAGTYTSYLLLENGQLFKKEGIKGGQFQTVEGITKKEAKPFFEQVEAFELATKKIDYPGNMTYFIEQITPDGNYKITWGGGEYTIDPKIHEFFTSLQKLVANRNVIQ